jgi:hypothetical protein
MGTGFTRGFGGCFGVLTAIAVFCWFALGSCGVGQAFENGFVNGATGHASTVDQHGMCEGTCP